MFVALIIFYLFFMLLAFAVPVATYILSSIGLYRMASACKLKSPYLAWVPIANLYILGSIAEISASRGGRKSMPFRKILPGLNAGVIAVAIAMIVCIFAFAFSEIAAMDYTDDSEVPAENVEFVSYSDADFDVDLDTDSDYDLYDDDEYYDEYDAEADELAASMVLIILPFYLILMAAAIVLSVFEYIALWHVYKLFDESNAVLYLLLTIFVSISMPIIYFILGRKTPALPVTEAPVAPAPVAVPAMVEAPAVEAPTVEAPAVETPSESGSDENQ